MEKAADKNDQKHLDCFNPEHCPHGYNAKSGIKSVIIMIKNQEPLQAAPFSFMSLDSAKTTSFRRDAHPCAAFVALINFNFITVGLVAVFYLKWNSAEVICLNADGALAAVSY